MIPFMAADIASSRHDELVHEAEVRRLSARRGLIRTVRRGLGRGLVRTGSRLMGPEQFSSRTA